MADNNKIEKTDIDRIANEFFDNKEYDKAFAYIKSVAETGDAYGQLCVGLMYCEGIGVQKDEEQAVYWHTESARQGNEDAAEWLAANSYDVPLAWRDTDKIAAIMRERYPDSPPVAWSNEKLRLRIIEAGLGLPEFPPNKDDIYLAGIKHKMILMWHGVDRVPVSFHENNKENIDDDEDVEYPDNWMS